jgi:hypothetical protein
MHLDPLEKYTWMDHVVKMHLQINTMKQSKSNDTFCSRTMVKVYDPNTIKSEEDFYGAV